MKHFIFFLFLLSTVVSCAPKVSVKGIATVKVPRGAIKMTDQEWINQRFSEAERKKVTIVNAIHYKINEGVLTLNGSLEKFENNRLQEDRKTWDALGRDLPGSTTTFKIIKDRKVLVICNSHYLI